MLWSLSLVVLAFFLAKATFSKVQLNWPAPAYIGFFCCLRSHRYLDRGLATSGENRYGHFGGADDRCVFPDAGRVIAGPGAL